MDETIIQYALNEVINNGRTAYAVARELDLNPETLSKRLRKLPEYREHRERATLTEDMSCPCCAGGTLEKQELFFWKCDCGSEFWPCEEQVPEDPDQWELTPLAQVSGQGDALALIRQLHSEGKNAAEISQALNEAGHKTPRDADWSRSNLLQYMKRHGVIQGDYAEQRERILVIVESMAGRQGISCKDIADRLNREGFKTSRNQPWSMHSVNAIIRKSLKLDVNLYRTDAIMLKREQIYGTEKHDPEQHPWRKADAARMAANRRRFGKK